MKTFSIIFTFAVLIFCFSCASYNPPEESAIESADDIDISDESWNGAVSTELPDFEKPLETEESASVKPNQESEKIEF